MAYEFQTVDISIFDFHVVIEALLNNNAIQPQFRFLTTATDYNLQYQSGQAVQTANLKIQPLSWRMLEHHHFWKYYKFCQSDGGRPDFWKLQMPFVCVQNQSQNLINLHTDSSNFAGTVRAFVFLSGMGWSTNLEIRLRGQIKPEELTNFVQRLPRTSASLFEINGNRKNLPDTFEYFSNLLKKEVYQPNIAEHLTIPRHHVINLTQFTGDIAHFRKGRADDKTMPAADRALMHSILLGEEIGIPRLAIIEKEKKFLLTEFIENEPDFALSYFDRGTLLFMQKTALTSNYAKWKARRKSMRCHSFNIRNCLLMMLTLQQFYRFIEKSALTNAKIKLLRDDIGTTIRELPHWYNNRFCQSFYYNHGPLQKLLQTF
jgi:hypothetical protein